MKAWLTTIAAALAVAQALTAAWMWQRLPAPGPTPSWVAPAHRWAGTLAFFATLPVAYHCLWALGFQQTTPRVLAHSILGWFSMAPSPRNCCCSGCAACQALRCPSQAASWWRA